MFRYRSSYKRYMSTPRPEVCPFCEQPGNDDVLEQTRYSFVIKNQYPYDLWEGMSVTEHLMVIPSRHVRSLGDLKVRELQDIIDLMARYEARGYNVYARAVGSSQRTVPLHQHTHLIKTDNKKARAFLFWRTPYYLKKI